MKRRYKIIAYLLIFITLFVWFEESCYASSTQQGNEESENLSQSEVKVLQQAIVDQLFAESSTYYNVNTVGAEGIVIPRIYV